MPLQLEVRFGPFWSVLVRFDVVWARDPQWEGLQVTEATEKLSRVAPGSGCPFLTFTRFLPALAGLDRCSAQHGARSGEPVRASEVLGLRERRSQIA